MEILLGQSEMHPSVIEFIGNALEPKEIRGAQILEVGSRDVNGSVRPMIEAHGSDHYFGIDIQAGPRVDRIMDAADLPGPFKAGAFDLLISTEMLEHAEDWRGAIEGMKKAVAPGGILLLTTRSPGFPHHEPPDHWRFRLRHLRDAFADWKIEQLERDSDAPGVFLRAKKPKHPRKKPNLSLIQPENASP
jgi:SAM-dependent methyltransferase